jgi:hypothetical protein
VNFIFNKEEAEPRAPKSSPPPGFFLFVLLFVLYVGWIIFNRVMSFRSAQVQVVESVDPAFQNHSEIRMVAESLGVPFTPAIRLSEFLSNEDFSGVGLFKVKPEHVDFLKDRFVPGAEVNLADPVMNANIALGLISSFHDRGYSWEQAFLIYVYGWGELAPSIRSAVADDFLEFVFGGEEDE